MTFSKRGNETELLQLKCKTVILIVRNHFTVCHETYYRFIPTAQSHAKVCNNRPVDPLQVLVAIFSYKCIAKLN